MINWALCSKAYDDLEYNGKDHLMDENHCHHGQKANDRNMKKHSLNPP